MATSPTRIQGPHHVSSSATLTSASTGTCTTPTASGPSLMMMTTATTTSTTGSSSACDSTHRVQVSCRFRSQNDGEIAAGGATCVRFSQEDPHTFFLAHPGSNSSLVNANAPSSATGTTNASPNGGTIPTNGTPNGPTSNTNSSRHSCFDFVFPGDVTQDQVYERIAAPFVNDLLKGYNCSILAYGQTGSGKTFTIFGERKPTCRGILPRFLEELLSRVAANNNNNNNNGAMAVDQGELETEVSASFIEVYQEKLRDLLYPQNTALRIREDKERGVWIDGVSEISVSSVDSAMNLIARGQSHRSTGSTQMNDNSSRSHGVVIVSLCRKNLKTLAKQKSKLFVVDLAGSEMVKKSCTSGKRLEEAKYINKSLSALGNVINALTSNILAPNNGTSNSGNPSSGMVTPSSSSSNNNNNNNNGSASWSNSNGGATRMGHIPYRDSKLTRLLQNSLGGNAKTHLILTCSSSDLHLEETQSTIRFGSRAKFIQNVARINRLQKQTVSEHQLQLFHTLEDKIEALTKYIVQLEKDKPLCGKCRASVASDDPRPICDEGSTSTCALESPTPSPPPPLACTVGSGSTSSRSGYCHGCQQRFNDEDARDEDNVTNQSNERIVCDGNCGFVWHLRCAKQVKAAWDDNEEFLCPQCDQERDKNRDRTLAMENTRLPDHDQQHQRVAAMMDPPPLEQEQPMLTPRWGTCQVDFKDKLMQEEMQTLRKCLMQMEKERHQSEHQSQLTHTINATKEAQWMQVQQQLQEQLHKLQSELERERASSAQLACCMNQALRDKALLEQKCEQLHQEVVESRHKMDASDAQSEILRKTLDRQDKHAKRLQVALVELQKELEELKKRQRQSEDSDFPARPHHAAAAPRSETPSSSSLADEDDIQQLQQLQRRSGQLPRVTADTCNSPLAKTCADSISFTGEKRSPSAGMMGSRRFNVNANLQNWWNGGTGGDQGNDNPLEDQQHNSLSSSPISEKMVRKAAAFCKANTTPATLPERAMTTAGLYSSSTGSSSSGSSPGTGTANRPFRTRLVGLLTSLEEETNSYRNLGERLALETRNCSRRTLLSTSNSSSSSSSSNSSTAHDPVVSGSAAKYLPCLSPTK